MWRALPWILLALAVLVIAGLAWSGGMTAPGSVRIRTSIHGSSCRRIRPDRADGIPAS